MKRIFSLLISIIYLSACSQVKPPEPFGPVPSDRQLAWHEMEYYMFVHFTVNTFTDKEWGYGDEKESVFNPSQLDCRQWAKVAKDAGMKGRRCHMPLPLQVLHYYVFRGPEHLYKPVCYILQVQRLSFNQECFYLRIGEEQI